MMRKNSLLYVFSVLNLIAGNILEHGNIADSVKEMHESGLPHQEIINLVKIELNIRGMSGLVDNEILTDEETTINAEELDDQIEIVLKRMQTDLKELPMFVPNALLNSPWNDKDLPKREYAYSPFDLIELVNTEELVYKLIKDYVHDLELRLDVMKNYVRDYDDSTGVVLNSLGSEPSAQAEAVVANPLAAYRLIRRFALQLPQIWSTIKEGSEQQLLTSLVKTMTNRPPDSQDLNESMEALLRIQYYGYSAEELSKGEIGSIKSLVKVTPEQSLEIGLHALQLKQFNQALEWLRVAEETKYQSYTDKPHTELLLYSINEAIYQHNEKYAETSGSENSHVDEYYLYDREIYNLQDIDDSKPKINRYREEAKGQVDNLEWGSHVTSNFVTLCSGGNFQSESEKSKLHCWVEKSVHAYLFINPVKMELLHSDPYIVQIYDVVGQEFIEAVQNYSIGKLERSYQLDYDDASKFVINNDRTSSSTWIHDRFSDTPVHNKVLNTLKLIEKITKLSVVPFRSSEAPQVACYGTSHLYGSHLDAIQIPTLTETESFGGDRIATFMLYLSSVEGGKTAFPLLGVAAEPIQGSGVFWYNFKRSGELDKRTHHGGCPVAHGIKWVMNSWIKAHDNFLNRPCALNAHE